MLWHEAARAPRSIPGPFLPFVVLIVLILAPGSVWPEPAAPVDSPGGKRPLTLERGTSPTPLAAKPPGRRHTNPSALTPLSGAASSSLHWYGFYDPLTGAAVEGETWTFDHGAADALEGWKDVTAFFESPLPWRRITAANWTGHGNDPLAPILSGSASMWLGYFEDEACLRQYVNGLGYGNNWCLQLISPPFEDPSGGGITVTFDCFYDMEVYFDSVRVLLAQGSTLTQLGALTDQGGSVLAPVHVNYAAVPGMTEPFRIVFEFTSDGGYSDEDGLYPTPLGPFGLDNVDVNGPGVFPLGHPPPYNFETGLQGFTVVSCVEEPNLIGLGDVSNYGISDPGCAVSGTILEFHDAAYQLPSGMLEDVISPAVPMPASGGPFNIFAEYDIYAEPALNLVAWGWGWRYYPYTCPSTGTVGWSTPVGNLTLLNLLFDDCRQIRTFATDTASTDVPYGAGTNLIPDGADSVRFILRVWNPSFEPPAEDPWPLFDNIRVGVSQRATVLHVPSPSYGTMQAGIEAADPGDTVLVRPGVYTGPGNHTLRFNGKNLVLLSEAGAEATIIDCEGTGPGIIFDGGEDASSEVCGFTFRNGDGGGVWGGAVRIEGASPTFRGCIVEHSTSSVQGGGVFVNGDPRFYGCQFQFNSTPDAGGGIAIAGGSPYFEDCVVLGNVCPTGGGGVLIESGSAMFLRCRIESNSANAGGGVAVVGGNPSFQECQIELNEASHQGGGVHVSAGGPSFGGSLIARNSANLGGGIQSDSWDGPTFSLCDIETNTAAQGGGGVRVSDGNAVFLGCGVTGNEASTAGGGALLRGGASFWSECTVLGNTGGTGGGMLVFEGAPFIARCTVAGNTGTDGGGVRIQPGSEPRFSESQITGNYGSSNGGGFWVRMGLGLHPEFDNCTIADNYCAGDGGGMYVENSDGAADTMHVTRSIVSSNCSALGEDLYFDTVNPASAVRFTCSAIDPSGVTSNGALVYVDGHVTAAPLFCAQAGCFSAPTSAGDYSISAASPCAAASSPCGQLIGARDVGCGPAGVDEPREALMATRLLQNVPNPFHSSTAIHFDLAEAGPVRLSVYDVSGRLLRTLLDGSLTAARHTIAWDGRDEHGRPVEGGICFYRLEAAGHSFTRKMLLLK